MHSPKSKIKTVMLVAMEKSLSPAIESMGFKAVIPSPDHDEEDFPEFFCWQRWNQDKLDLLEVQFYQRGKPKFVINLGEVPPEGVQLPWGHVEQTKARLSMLEKRARLFRDRNGMPKWFAPRLWRRLFGAEQAVQAVIDEVIQLLPEAEAWLQNGKIGPHIKLMHVPLSVAKA